MPAWSSPCKMNDAELKNPVAAGCDAWAALLKKHTLKWNDAPGFDLGASVYDDSEPLWRSGAWEKFPQTFVPRRQLRETTSLHMRTFYTPVGIRNRGGEKSPSRVILLSSDLFNPFATNGTPRQKRTYVVIRWSNDDFPSPLIRLEIESFFEFPGNILTTA